MLFSIGLRHLYYCIIGGFIIPSTTSLLHYSPQHSWGISSFIYHHSELHQLQLLLPGQLLDPVLPAHGLLLCGKAFVIHQLHRPFGPGIFGACFAFIMGFHPPGKAVCPAGVERAVCTLHDVCIVHSSLLFCKKFMQYNAKCQYIFSNITPDICLPVKQISEHFSGQCDLSSVIFPLL